MSLPDSISGFQLIPVAYSPSSIHVLYARAHVNPKKAASHPNGRTLFLVNVPPDATEREIISFFKHCGTIEKVIFDKDIVEQAQDPQSDSDTEAESEGAEVDDEGEKTEKPRKRRKLSKEEKKPPTLIPLPTTQLRTLRKTGQSAHIVFLDDSSLVRALSPTQKPRPWPSSPEPRGLAHYQALYTSLRPPLDIIAEHANSAIEVYEYNLAKSRHQSKYRKGEAIVDEDGFTLVTRGGAYGQTLGGGVGIASRKFQAAAQDGGASGRKKKKKRGKEKEKEGFYAFQSHEKRRKELVDLQKNWEEDKEKVKKLKESKRFKPY